MLAAPIPDNDDDRVASLKAMNLLSTPREADLDRITRTAQKIFGTEMALVSLVDKERQWFKSRVGLDAPETPRDVSFCGHALHDEQTFVVEDATKDERFHDNPLVTGGPNVRFYAGQPLTNVEGFRIGTLCVISPKARDFTSEDQQTLQDLGRMVEIVLANRKLSETQVALLDSLNAAERDKLIDPLTGIWNRRGLDDLFPREISRAVRGHTPLAVAMVDIDHFKQVNDTYGHATGDEAIKLAAALLVEGSRATDIVARFGGEEFVVISPGVAPAMLPTIGNKMLSLFRARAKVQTPQGDYPFTISIGLTTTLKQKKEQYNQQTLLETADQAMLAAKEAGRDGYKIAGVPKNLYSDFALA